MTREGRCCTGITCITHTHTQTNLAFRTTLGRKPTLTQATELAWTVDKKTPTLHVLQLFDSFVLQTACLQHPRQALTVSCDGRPFSSLQYQAGLAVSVCVRHPMLDKPQNFHYRYAQVSQCLSVGIPHNSSVGGMSMRTLFAYVHGLMEGT